MLLVLVSRAPAVLLIDHDFAGGNQGWGDRDPGEMNVGWTGVGGFGNPATSGSMQGDFAGSVFTPETDAFRLTSGLGDLTQAGVYDLVSFSFQFYAAHVVPADLILRVGNGSHTFFRGFTVSSTLNWQTFTAPLSSVSGWFGGTQAQFDSVLTSTTFIDIQVSRSGFDAQTYYFDNFQLTGVEAGNNNDDNNGGGGPSAVPEPNTINLLVSIGLLGLASRRIWGRPESAAS
ncbi:MAG TPA: PEP-CTERM sorting domain-containing protein [Kiritimatiellia bacterium]|nr:PEP-CTERM sorting domain-containing protein [Kiritimatiellia bacterium]